ncbi:universal stress protein [Haloglomus irregulare]|uniref:Universal stress protein n=1 Tax=Haloglomus irregulare TaxID=2234134 RepID=A0A554NCD5_9EURY|nr:universal stress protein [Haloglomus irregulare]TSD15056.1 universal stress protein [Haloglomus irregulare]
MYDRILLPTDGSTHAMTAAEHALALSRAFDATIHVLGVADIDRAAGLFDAGGVDEAFLERVRAETGTAVERTATLAAANDPVETAVVDGDPADAIADYVAEAAPDAIVMGTHGRRGITRFVAGSVTERVLRTATVPVFTVRCPDGEARAEGAEPTVGAAGEFPTCERVLLPTDGSGTAERAVDHAVAIADAIDGELHALNVVDVAAAGGQRDPVPSGTAVEALTEQGEAAVDAVAERADDAGVPVVTAVRQGFPESRIRTYARENGADVVVMGTHGRTGLGRVLLGSTVERLVRRAEMPVCAVPPADRDGVDEGGLP